MKLRYPHARLILSGLLVGDRLSGAEAIAECACDFNLITPQDLAHIVTEFQGQACFCLAAARKVIDHYFKNRPVDGKEQSADSQSAWLETEKNIARCIDQADAKELPKKECRHHAPVVFDLLLQHIGRYP